MHQLPQQILRRMTPDERAGLLARYTPVGINSETNELEVISDVMLASGLYIGGVQGVGKSFCLENIAVHHANQNRGLVFIDPHGDSVYRIVSRLSEEALSRTYLLNMKDRSHTFGLNPFANISEDQRDQVLNQLLHLFEVNWPEIMSQQYAPIYLRACILVLLANPGSTMLDMLPLLTSQHVRSHMVAHMPDATVREFWAQHEALSSAAQMQHVGPIINRLNALFMGQPVLRRIVGQKETTLNFRRSIENREIILIPLPLKTNEAEAKWVGSIILSILRSAILSFLDTPESQRSGVSVFMDECQEFVSPDFAELFTQARKAGCRLTLANQYLGQLPPYLRQAVQTAGTKLCFRVIPDDAREMAQYFIHGQTTIRPEDMTKYPVEELLHL